MDISWFMHFVNEGIARQANAKDNCTGRFWEGRFSSQALLDEAAFAACMVYVDLNPVRSRMSGTPETSDHTSIKKRIQHVLNIEPSDYQKLQPEGLYPFVGNPRTDMPDGLPFELSEYIELVDLTGKQLREGGTRSFAPATAILVHPCTSFSGKHKRPDRFCLYIKNSM
ncbi:Mobile element protein [hydrothermal vent metagenome]|uniref:Mobile element protein n=1 Tax=hydrothermal vent metagenome TaxID=652676 RepID=A0A3B0Y1P8_9ZZZZ